MFCGFFVWFFFSGLHLGAFCGGGWLFWIFFIGTTHMFQMQGYNKHHVIYNQWLLNALQSGKVPSNLVQPDAVWCTASYTDKTRHRVCGYFSVYIK